MGWFENAAASFSDPDNYIANSMSLGQYSLADATLPDNRRKDEPLPFPGGSGDRLKDLERGYARGQEEFYNDPDMQNLRARREDLSKGYDGKALGALREQSRADIAGQRSKYLQQLSSNAARGGIGGARSAAMRGAADANFAGLRAENERKINVDQANQINKGTDALQDFYFRQKLGKMGTGLGEAELGVADRTSANQASIAAREPKQGLFSRAFGGFL